MFHLELHQVREAREAGEFGLALARATPDRDESEEICHCVRRLAEVARHEGDLHSARSYFEEVVCLTKNRIERARAYPDPDGYVYDRLDELPSILRELADVSERMGDPAAARAFLEEAYSASLTVKQRGDGFGTLRDHGMCAYMLARILSRLEGNDAARPYFEEALQDQFADFNTAANIRSGEVVEITNYLLPNIEDPAAWKHAIEVYRSIDTGFHHVIFDLNVLVIEILTDAAATLTSLGNLDRATGRTDAALNANSAAVTIFFRMVVVANIASPLLLGNYSHALLCLGSARQQVGDINGSFTCFRAAAEALTQHQRRFGETDQTRALTTLVHQALVVQESSGASSAGTHPSQRGLQ
jgi:tetratricopeptide (TPR) repeat protein